MNRLGKGAQGSVYLVKDKRDGKEYVMKMVECNDESEADKAFREVQTNTRRCGPDPGDPSLPLLGAGGRPWR
jgi:serine/threonine protein kinase